jgi:hypothetical protein
MAGLVGCAASAAGGSEPARYGSRNVISQAEIRDLELDGCKSVYDAVVRVRSHWLRPRGMSITVENPIQVFVSGSHAGELGELESMRLDGVSMIRFISPSDATNRWGTGYSSGVIEVIHGPSPIGGGRRSPHLGGKAQPPINVPLPRS